MWAVASGVLQTGERVWTGQWSEMLGQKGLFMQERVPLSSCVTLRGVGHAAWPSCSVQG